MSRTIRSVCNLNEDKSNSISLMIRRCTKLCPIYFIRCMFLLDNIKLNCIISLFRCNVHTIDSKCSRIIIKLVIRL